MPSANMLVLVGEIAGSGCDRTVTVTAHFRPPNVVSIMSLFEAPGWDTGTTPIIALLPPDTRSFRGRKTIRGDSGR